MQLQQGEFRLLPRFGEHGSEALDLMAGGIQLPTARQQRLGGAGAVQAFEVTAIRWLTYQLSLQFQIEVDIEQVWGLFQQAQDQLGLQGRNRLQGLGSCCGQCYQRWLATHQPAFQGRRFEVPEPPAANQPALFWPPSETEVVVEQLLKRVG